MNIETTEWRAPDPWPALPAAKVQARGLLAHQLQNVSDFLPALRAHGCALDASDTGTGKTRTAATTARALGLPVVVICTAGKVDDWKAELRAAGARVALLGSYESMRLKGAHGHWTGGRFRFRLKQKCLFIFDEYQFTTGLKTLNSRLLMSAHELGCPVYLMSATPLHSAREAWAFGRVFRLHNNDAEFEVMVSHYSESGRDFVKDFMALRRCAVRATRWSEIKGFPSTQVQAVTVEGDSAIVDDFYRRFPGGAPQGKHMRERRALELSRVPGMVRLAEGYLARGVPVAALFCFRASVGRFVRQLKRPAGVLMGNETAAGAAAAKAAFISGRVSVFSGTIAAGGTGIDLHDPVKRRPRAMLISPGTSAREVKQGLGRVHRLGGGWSIQLLAYIAGSCEEAIAERLRGRLRAFETFRDSDFEIKWTDGAPVNN